MLTALLLFALSAAAGHAQSTFQRFRQLSPPMRAWTLRHLGVARRVQAVSSRALALTDSMRGSPDLDGDLNGGSLDAFRHGVWMALLVQEIRPRKAERLGQAYERGNAWQFRHGRLEDGSQQDAVATQMDLHNNAMGRQIGSKTADPTEQQLVWEVCQAIAEGKMRIILKDKSGWPLDCAGKPIPEADWKGKWETERCLVPSNRVRE